MTAEPNKYFEVIDVGGVIDYVVFGFVFYVCACLVRTPNGNKVKRGIIFTTAEEADNVKRGDRYVM